MSNLIKVLDASEEETGFARTITFTLDGEEYTTTLYWNRYDGYDWLDHDIYEILETALEKELETTNESVASYMDALSYDYMEGVNR